MEIFPSFIAGFCIGAGFIAYCIFEYKAAHPEKDDRLPIFIPDGEDWPIFYLKHDKPLHIKYGHTDFSIMKIEKQDGKDLTLYLGTIDREKGVFKSRKTTVIRSMIGIRDEVVDTTTPPPPKKPDTTAQ